MKLTKSILAKAAKNLNAVLFEDEELTTEGSLSEVKKRIKEAAKLLEEGDELEELTIEVLTELGVATEAYAPDEDDDEEDDAENAADEDDDEEDEDDDDDEEDDDEEDDDEEDEDEDDELPLEEQIKAAKKLVDLKALLEDSPEFKKAKKALLKEKNVMVLRKKMMAIAVPVEDDEDDDDDGADLMAKQAAAKASVAKDKAKNKETKPASKKPKKKTKSSMIIECLTPYLTKGKKTKLELIAIAEEALEEEGIAASTIRTVLTDGKNPKYNQFPTLLVENGKGFMTFSK